MPEVLLTMQWPDGSRSSLYSPSTVIHEHFKAGERLTVAEVKRRGSVALQQASERVRARYGFACTCLLYTSPSPRDQRGSRMPSSA